MTEGGRDLIQLWGELSRPMIIAGDSSAICSVLDIANAGGQPGREAALGNYASMTSAGVATWTCAVCDVAGQYSPAQECA